MVEAAWDNGEQHRRPIGWVAEIGQQVPVVVIRDAERLVLIAATYGSRRCAGCIATRRARRCGR